MNTCNNLQQSPQSPYSNLKTGQRFVTCTNALISTYTQGQRSAPIQNNSPGSNICVHTHTHTLIHFRSILPLPNIYPAAQIIIWQSATTLKSLCFRPFNLRTTLFLWGLTAFHWKKGPFTTKTFRWKNSVETDGSGLESDHY